MLFDESLSTILNEQTNLCLSGGADGADLQWGMNAGLAGHKVIHWSFNDHRTSAPTAELVRLSDEQLKQADDALKRANKLVKRNWPSNSVFTNNLLRRNWYQVKDSQSVYAVSDVKGQEISGGTAWAVQMYLDRFIYGEEDMDKCQAYVLDKQTGVWYSFRESKWMCMNSRPPVPTGVWAGIGSREISLLNRIEIRKLMGTHTRSMINHLHPIISEPKVNDIIYIPNQKFDNGSENTAGGWATIRRITEDGKNKWISVSEIYMHNEFKWSDLVDLQIELREQFKNVRACPKPE